MKVFIVVCTARLHINMHFKKKNQVSLKKKCIAPFLLSVVEGDCHAGIGNLALILCLCDMNF